MEGEGRSPAVLRGAVWVAQGRRGAGAGSGGHIPGRQRDPCSDPWPENTRCDCGGKKRARVTVSSVRHSGLELGVRPDLGASPRVVAIRRTRRDLISRLARSPDDST